MCIAYAVHIHLKQVLFFTNCVEAVIESIFSFTLGPVCVVYTRDEFLRKPLPPDPAPWGCDPTAELCDRRVFGIRSGRDQFQRDTCHRRGGEEGGRGI